MVRLKVRYFVFEVTLKGQYTYLDDGISRTEHDQSKEDELKIDTKMLFQIIRESILLNFGEIGLSKVQSLLSVMYYNPTTRIGIARTYREHHNMVWNALTLISNIKGRECCLNVIHVSASFKLIQKRAIKYDRDIILYLRKLETLDNEIMD